MVASDRRGAGWYKLPYPIRGRPDESDLRTEPAMYVLADELVEPEE